MLEYLRLPITPQVLYVEPSILGPRKAVHLYRRVGMTCEVIFGVDTLVEVVGYSETDCSINDAICGCCVKSILYSWANTV